MDENTARFNICHFMGLSLYWRSDWLDKNVVTVTERTREIGLANRLGIRPQLL